MAQNYKIKRTYKIKRRIAKYRRFLTVVITLFCMGGLILLGIWTNSIKKQRLKPKVYSGIAMGTAVKKTIYAESESQSEAVDKVIDQCLRELENRISVRITDSEIAKCNRNYAAGGVYELPQDIMASLSQEMQIWKETDGAFSPCIRPLSVLWGIEDGSTEIPEEEQIREALSHTDAGKIELTDHGIIFRENDMAIDFGAVGKGIACDEVMKELEENNVRGAVVSIGGSIAVYGDKGDGKAWHIGIQDPRGEDGDVFGVLKLKSGQVVSTSGDYEKYFEEKGRRYHHILDPSTGYPAHSGLISVTVISDNGFLSDALSTACFVLGLERGMDYAEEKGVQAVFVTSDKSVYVTKGIRKSFFMQAKDYTLKKRK